MIKYLTYNQLLEMSLYIILPASQKPAKNGAIIKSLTNERLVVNKNLSLLLILRLISCISQRLRSEA